MFETTKRVLRAVKPTADKLCTERGGSRFRIAADMLMCYARYHTLPDEYFNYGFDLVPRSERKNYLTEHWGTRTSKALNNRLYRGILDNKFYLSQILAPYYGRSCVQNTCLTPERFRAFTAGQEKFILKPISGFGGRGHKVYHLDGSRPLDDIYQEVVSAPRSILEQWIVQHEALSSLYPDAVHIVRLDTIHSGDLSDLRIFGFNLSIACQGEIANTCISTTLSAQIDPETGILVTDAFDDAHRILTEVPGTGAKIRGFKVPYWQEALELVKQAAAAIPELRYIGWDVAFTPDGPVIVEGNFNPGVDGAQSFTWYKDGYSRGMWPIVEPYYRAAVKKRKA